MASTVADIMTGEPETIQSTEPILDAARKMRDVNTGAVVVLDDGAVSGIVTDRDIVVRAVAEGRDLTMPVSEICSHTNLETVDPDTPLEQAAHIMRTRAMRRLPVVENGRLIGVISIGDLAMERDERSALADISAAPSNR